MTDDENVSDPGRDRPADPEGVRIIGAQEAAEALEECGVLYEAHVLSAHRTPRRMLDYAESAAGRGLRVVIAGAGGAAHLPGMVAAATPLPDTDVVGDPVGRLPHLVTFSCLYVAGDAIVHALAERGFGVASGSACTASSHSGRAIGRS